MAARDLTYVELVSGMGDPHNDRRGPRLQVATAGGTIREVPMSRADLLRVIERAARALAHLDRLESTKP